MAAWSSYSYLFGPLVAALAIGVFVLILRWSSQRGGSLVPGRPVPGTEDEYGLLVVISRPATAIEGEIQRRTLIDAGIRATLTTTLEGPRVMVWPEDELKAKSLISH